MPVSSSAHLALLPGLLGWEEPADRTAFAAALHAGSCAGLLWALRSQLPVRELPLLALVSVPPAVAGLALGEAVEARLGRPLPTAALTAVAGALLAAADTRPADRPLGTRPALAAGLAQVLALAPGVSRSGASLTALRALRVAPAEAHRFALLMSLPVTAGAAVLSLARADRRAVLTPAVAAAVPAAAVAAAVAVRRAPVALRSAAVYRVAFAAVVAAHHLRRRG